MGDLLLRRNDTQNAVKLVFKIEEENVLDQMKGYADRFERDIVIKINKNTQNI